MMLTKPWGVGGVGGQTELLSRTHTRAHTQDGHFSKSLHPAYTLAVTEPTREVGLRLQKWLDQVHLSHRQRDMTQRESVSRSPVRSRLYVREYLLLLRPRSPDHRRSGLELSDCARNRLKNRLSTDHDLRHLSLPHSHHRPSHGTVAAPPVAREGDRPRPSHPSEGDHAVSKKSGSLLGPSQNAGIACRISSLAMRFKKWVTR